MHHDRYLSHKLLFMEPKGSDIAKSLAVQVVNPCKSVLDKKEPSNQLMQLQRNQRSNDIESTFERILVERQLVIQTCSSHAKQMWCLKWWVQSSTLHPSGYFQEGTFWSCTMLPLNANKSRAPPSITGSQEPDLACVVASPHKLGMSCRVCTLCSTRWPSKTELQKEQQLNSEQSFKKQL